MKKLNRPILAEGEVTGHAHRLNKNIDVFETENKTRVFTPKQEVIVEHEEHKSITLKPKEYESDKVIEYDHFAEEARKVQD